MDELKAALEEALSGHGQLVMLVGEPGIGQDPYRPRAGHHSRAAERMGAVGELLRGARRSALLALGSGHTLLHPEARLGRVALPDGSRCRRHRRGGA
jgi:hypothetical protein